jgi:hypothetical protein
MLLAATSNLADISLSALLSTHQDYGMYSAPISLQRLFYDGLNTRNPDITNTTNPGDKPKVVHFNGTHAYATPKHEILASSLLGGSVVVTFLTFLVLPLFCRSNYDDAWERDAAWTKKGW